MANEVVGQTSEERSDISKAIYRQAVGQTIERINMTLNAILDRLKKVERSQSNARSNDGFRGNDHGSVGGNSNNNGRNGSESGNGIWIEPNGENQN